MARVLIIEDDGDLQHVLSVLFNRENYEVHYAFNGKEGYEKILSVQPDVILLDLMMPILNGVEVVKLVSTNVMIRDIPIIVMSAYGDDVNILESSIKAQGVRAYVRKPFKLEYLKNLVRRMIAQYPRKPVTPTQVAKGVVRLDKKFRTVWVSDRVVATISPVKADVLKILLDAKGPVKRERLLQSVWGNSQKTSALEKTIQRLREDLGPEGHRIQTTPEGYELIG